MIGKRNTALVRSPKFPANGFSLLNSVALSLMATSALADPPTTKRLVGTLVSPSTAWSYYGTATAHTNGLASTATRAPEIRALARALSRDGALTGDAFAQRVADYVRKNIETEFRFGLGKGARGAAIDQSGTVFDQAQLMVEILRERGQVATYQLGTITLNADQFGKWTGLVTNLNQPNQTFTINAQAACQMLADGGIPAIVNGASSCVGLTGALSTVTLGHLWVVTNGKSYDPGFKVSVLKAGIDIPAAMGCGTAVAPTCGAGLETAAMTGALQGTAYGAPYIQNVNQAAVESYVQARAVSLQTAIETVDPTAPLEDVIGGAKIDLKQSIAAGATLSYPSTGQGTAWTGDIPDTYRVKFQIQFMGLSTFLYADELATRRVRLATTAPRSSWLRTSKLFLDGQEIATGSATGAFYQTDRVSITVTHPYASGFANETAAIAIGVDPRNSSFVVSSANVNAYHHNTALLILDVGRAGAGRQAVMAKLMADHRDEGGFLWINSALGVQAASWSQEKSQSIVSNLLLQTKLTAGMISRIGGSSVLYQHGLGAIANLPNPNALSTTYTQTNLRSSYSVTSRSASVVDEDAVFSSLAASDSALEGSVQLENSDAYEASNTMGLLKLANASGQKLFLGNSTNKAPLFSSLQGYAPERKAILQSFLSGLNTAIVPEKGDVGYLFGTSASTSLKIYLVTGGEVLMGINQLGYSVLAEYKGASIVGSTDPAKAALESAKQNAILLKSKQYYSLDVASGVMTLSPPADVESGSGSSSLEFRRSYRSAATGKLVCSPRAVTEDLNGYPIPIPYPECSSADGGLASIVGGGWNHNLNSSGTWVGNGVEGLGQTSALRASRAIAALTGLFDVNRAPSFQKRVTAAFVGYSFMRSFVRNLVSVDFDMKSMQFIRLPSGRYDPPFGQRGTKISVSGNPTGPYLTGSISGFNSIETDFTSTSLNMVAGDGAILNLVPSEGMRVAGFSLLTAGFPFSNKYVVDKSIQPTGFIKKFLYILNDYYSGSRAWRSIVSGSGNSSGRSISLIYSNYYGPNGNVAQSVFETFQNGYGRVSGVSSNDGQVASFQCDYGSSPASDSFGGLVPSILFGSRSYYYTDCAGSNINRANATTKYGYPYGDGSYTGSLYPDRIIKSWHTPLNQAAPYIIINYDPTLKVASFTDIGSKVTTAFTSTIADDRYRIGELQDPTGAVTSTIFDENASALQVTDPNGRVTSNVYDNARRLIRTVMPEGNAVEYTYDLRGNKTRECAIPKGVVNWSSLTALNEQVPQCNTSRAPVADLATTTSYLEAANLRADQCVNMKTCNKPSYVVDAKGARTDYEWSGVHGQLTKETGPADINGVRPVTGYGYSAYTGVDSAVFYLLTSKVETISSGMTTTTAYEYDTANKFVLKSAVVDSGGLSLRTCYTFDPAGNLISKTEPKAGLAVCP
jgi:YD repeat-containing protein